MSDWDLPLFWTVVDVVVIIIAALLGLMLKDKLKEEHQEAVTLALGLSALFIGIGMYLNYVNPLVILISVTAGYLIGFWWDLEGKMNKLGDFFKKIALKFGFAKDEKEKVKFSDAFAFASAVSLIGPLAIIGPFMEGMSNDPELLIIKIGFDFFATTVFAATMGAGVLFSFIPVFLFQGAFAMIGSLFSQYLISAECTAEMFTEFARDQVPAVCLPGREALDEMTATGGILITAMGLKVSGIREIAVLNFLPAILLTIPVTVVINFVFKLIYSAI
jgi:hypothetical protein